MDIILINLGYLLVLLALAIREILWMRISLMLSQATFFTFFILSHEYNLAIWNAVFLLVNVTQIIIIYRERLDLAIPKEIKDIYENIFHTMSNREFLHFWHQGQLNHTKDKQIIKGGEIQKDLMLILNGNAAIMRNGEIIATLERGQFIAEISFITGNPASADVLTLKGLTYYIWDKNNLDKFRQVKPETMGKLDSILSLDMAGKLTK